MKEVKVYAGPAKDIAKFINENKIAREDILCIAASLEDSYIYYYTKTEIGEDKK